MNTAFSRSEQMRIDPAIRASQKPRDPDAVDLRGLLGLFVKRWKLIFGSALIAAIATYLAVSQMTVWAPNVVVARVLPSGAYMRRSTKSLGRSSRCMSLPV